MKIALVGAGSYVFGRSVLYQALVEHRLSGLHIALVDVDEQMLSLMQGAGRRLADELGLELTLTTHTDRAPAFQGASFVLNSAAIQLRSRFAMDREIIKAHYPEHLVTEFGGVAGISYSMRQMSFIDQVCEDIKAYCPDAWLLNTANPLPRLCQYASQSGVNAAGFCSASLEGYRHVWRLLHDEDPLYDFTKPIEKYDLKMAGLNHCCVVLSATDRVTGQDVLQDIRDAALNHKTFGNPRCEKLLRETGYLFLPNDHHVQDFLTVEWDSAHPRTGGHGTADEREQQKQTLRQIGSGELPWQRLGENPSWERPMDVVASAYKKKTGRLHSVNLRNGGRFAEFPEEVFVETAASLDENGIHPDAVELPETLREMMQRTASVTDLIVQSALERNHTRLKDALELDPTIDDEAKAWAAVSACLETHAEILTV